MLECRVREDRGMVIRSMLGIHKPKQQEILQVFIPVLVDSTSVGDC